MGISGWLRDRASKSRIACKILTYKDLAWHSMNRIAVPPWYRTCLIKKWKNMTTIAIHTLEPWAGAGFVYGRGAGVQSLNALVAEIAKTDIPVLLVGESGTGKEIYARLIHRLSGLGESSLKKVSCASLEAGRLLGEIQEEIHTRTGRIEGAARTAFFGCSRTVNRAAGMGRRARDLSPRRRATWKKKSKQDVFAGNSIFELTA